MVSSEGGGVFRLVWSEPRGLCTVEIEVGGIGGSLLKQRGKCERERGTAWARG
jgi:hypothetical protein